MDEGVERIDSPAQLWEDRVAEQDRAVSAAYEAYQSLYDRLKLEGKIDSDIEQLLGWKERIGRGDETHRLMDACADTSLPVGTLNAIFDNRDKIYQDELDERHE